MSNADLNVGDKVTLSEYSEWTGPFNPRHTVGEVYDVKERWVYVDWGDKKCNSYYRAQDDLIPFK